MKIIDKINEKLNKKEKFFSFEYFPPKTEGGIDNLIERIERMSSLNPQWVDITWGAGGTTSDSTLFISSYIQNYLNIDCLMHLTCRCQSKENIDQALEEAKKNGIVNILALRGDPPQGTMNYDSSKDYFQYASDLVKYIREQYGDYFCIVVAGYPETHGESKTKEEDLKYLKLKVDAGADLIITQLFFDVDVYMKYIKDVSDYGIKVPVLPGLLPVQNYNSFKRIINLCKTTCPPELAESLEKVKNDDEKVKEVGIDHTTKMCMQLLDNGILGLHFYTLNLEKSVSEVLRRINLTSSPKNRELPWKKNNHPKRNAENVRPIFWKNNSKSYLSKTWYWDEYPNGIWGDSRSPAFGNISEHFLSFCKDYIKENKKSKQLRKIWGENLTCIDDVSKTFINYIEGKINKLPWCEETEIQTEIVLIKDLLINLNQKKIFTINSQPAANCKPSSDPYVGWGPSNGFIFQRFYIEFFIDSQKLDILIQFLKQSNTISYQAINKNGDVVQSINQPFVTALTWGVFPNREILQPTIYDSEVFSIWKEEAFNLWNEWIKVYDDPDNENDQTSAALLRSIQNDYYLVTILDNDFVTSKVEQLLNDFLKSI